MKTGRMADKQPSLGVRVPLGSIFSMKEIGNVVHNQVDPATDLLIPERFFVLHEQFLERPWNEITPGWHYWKNVAINIVGFTPLGFFFYAYFCRAER